MVIMGVKGESWRVQNSWGEGAHNKGIVKMHQQSHIREAYIIYGEKDNV
jgi:aminopeptidase C